MNHAPGLVRYDTQNGLAQQLTRSQRLRRILRPRVLGYSDVLVLIVAALLTSIMLRPLFKVDVVRDRSTLARQVGDGDVENVYRLQIMNPTETPQSYRLTAQGPDGLHTVDTRMVAVAATEARWVGVTLRLLPQAVASTAPGVHEIAFDIERLAQGGDAAHSLREKSTFVLPRCAHGPRTHPRAQATIHPPHPFWRCRHD